MTVPEIVMAIGLLLTVLAVGYLVWKSHQSAAAPSALDALKADATALHDWTAEEVSKFNSARPTWTVGPGAPAAATLSPAPVQATSIPGWALGTSYTSAAALLADVARPDFPPVRIDGKQEAGVAGFDFYTLPDGSVSQSKPA